jgi:hypothetical protein
MDRRSEREEWALAPAERLEIAGSKLVSAGLPEDGVNAVRLLSVEAVIEMCACGMLRQGE